MPTTRELLEHHGLVRIADALESHIRPSCQLVSAEYGEEWPNRLGGRPNLPPEIAWPMWDNEPLAFISQLDLATLPHLPGLEMPRAGSLFFFYEGLGYGFEGPPANFRRVFFSEQPSCSFPLRDLPGNLDSELQLRAVHLARAPVTDSIPGGEDTLLDLLALTGDERTSYDAFLEEWDAAHPKFKPGTPLSGYPSWVQMGSDMQRICDEQRHLNPGVHRVGGYQDCVQFADPKMEAYLTSRGHDTKDVSTWEEPQRTEALREALEWQLLLQVDSEFNADIAWGDSGRLYFLIHKDDLRERRFEKTFLTMQSH
jgi:uncharacterized protein YwqG